MIGFEYGSQVKIDLVALHLVAVLHHQDRAERHLQARADRRRSCRRVADDDLALVRRDDLLSLGVRDDDQAIAVLDDARDLDLARRLLGDTSRRSADVEGAQRELRARLADRLRGDDADRLADVHHRPSWPGCGRSTCGRVRASPRT